MMLCLMFEVITNDVMFNVEKRMMLCLMFKFINKDVMFDV